MREEATTGNVALGNTGSPPAFKRIPSATKDRSALASVVSDQMVPMRDGARLATDVYLPGGDGPLSTVLTRLPYGKTEAWCNMPEVAEYWTRKGYAAVVQDVRGKWGSEGVFEPNLNRHEIPDGYDTIEWISRQPWSNGRVGMWGQSYYGFTSYAGAVSGHPALKCIAPGNISLDRFSCTFRYGCLHLNTMGTWAIAMTDQTYQDLSRLDYWHLPLADIGRHAGATSGYFDEIIANPEPSQFWEERSLLAGYECIHIPVLHRGGWYDTYLGPTITDWRRMNERDQSAGNQHLFIGPWDHRSTADLVHRVGLLPVAEGTAEARFDTNCAFFDRYLSGWDTNFGARGQIRYFVMGKDVWRDADSWPPRETRLTPVYLRSNGGANTRSGDGRLSWDAPPAGESHDCFVYDPANPVADTLGIDCWSLAGEMGDRRELEERLDVLVYSTEPLTDGLELTGPIVANICFSSDAPDTDVTVALVDVAPDESANLIQDGILRTRYRDGVETPALMEPGKVYALEIDVWSVSYALAPGHRLRLEISSSCFNRYDRNLNTGEPFGTGAIPVKATQRVFHDATRPSTVVLPVHPG